MKSENFDSYHETVIHPHEVTIIKVNLNSLVRF